MGLGGSLAQSSAWRGRRVEMNGWVNLGARFYDPESGAFLSYDPQWNSRDPNYLTFAGGDPVNYFDSDGRLGKSLPDDNVWDSYQKMMLAQAVHDAKPGVVLGENSSVVYNRAIDSGAGSGEASYEGASYAIGSLTGYTPLYEGTSAYDIAAAKPITDPVDRWARTGFGTVGVVSTGLMLQSGGNYAYSSVNAWMDSSLDFLVSPPPERGSSIPGNMGFVVVNPPPNATPQQLLQVQQYVDGANQALQTGLLDNGRVSTAGSLRDAASAAAATERARAAAASTPYQGQAGHVPDTTWMGVPEPFMWLDLDPRVNLSLGGQVKRYPIGYTPMGFDVGTPKTTAQPPAASSTPH